jgi:hypothetical protein
LLGLGEENRAVKYLNVRIQETLLVATNL